jgi:hypothetical protein
MTKSMLLLIFVFATQMIVAQQKMPAYAEVVAQFLKKYERSDDFNDYTTFQKKKDGWYVAQIDRSNRDYILSAQLFWDNSTEAYLQLNYNASNDDKATIDEAVANSLTDNWYNYDHHVYYGYNDYAEGIIQDFANKKELSDDERESLARAYSFIANKYLGYTKGGYSDGSDSLQTPLRMNQMPSEQRMKIALSYIDKSIEQYEQLALQNPAYQTLVGNVSLRLFNEYMHAYNQLMIYGFDQYIQTYLDKIKLDSRSIQQAKNYLNSCPKNAILFTFGDNDTYQLWYVQAMLSYRKDVAVINNSLLALPAYINRLRSKHIVEFSAPAKFLEDTLSLVAMAKKRNEDSKNAVTLQKTLQTIFYKKAVDNQYGSYKVYPSSSIMLPVTKQLTLKGNSNTLYLNDIMLLDIIQTNYRKRPICYTSYYDPIFKEYLFPKGIVYELETTDSSRFNEFNKHVFKAIKQFKENVFIPVRSDRSSIDQYRCADGDNTANILFFNLILFEIQNNNMDGAKTLINEWIAQLVPNDNMPWYELQGLVYVLEQTNQIERAVPYMELSADDVMRHYKNPNALTGYMTRQRALSIIKDIKDQLERVDTSNSKVEQYYSDLQE